MGLERFAVPIGIGKCIYKNIYYYVAFVFKFAISVYCGVE
jgi:hypothetical protein